MKKFKSFISLFVIAIILLLTGCSSKQIASENSPDLTPDLARVKSICELAVLECYYHNVAKSVKPKDGFGTKEREFWIEYTGIVKIGVDMSKIKMDIDSADSTIVNITIPEAEVFDVNVDDSSLTEDSYIASKDGIRENKITADDQTAAIKAAQDTMREIAENDSGLLQTAQNRAKKLIENYVKKLGEACSKEYTINWVDYSEADSVQTTAETTTSN